jgi:hypothetical protein
VKTKLFSTCSVIYLVWGGLIAALGIIARINGAAIITAISKI